MSVASVSPSLQPQSSTTNLPTGATVVKASYPTGSTLTTIFLRWSVAFITWGIGVLLIFIFLSDTSWFAWRQLVARYILRSAYITLNNGTFDRNQYIVHSAKLNKAGYLALFLGGEYDKGAKTPVAHTSRLLPGTYTNVQIKIDADRLAQEDPLMYTPGSTLYVGLYYDDGDNVFNSINPDIPKDIMATDRLGQPILTKLTIQ